MNRRGVLCAALLLALAGCQGEGDITPQGAAEAFIDRHYVEIDLLKARELTAGLARSKLDEELRLTSGQAIDVGTRKPRVYYKLLQRRESRGRTAFVYELTIRPDGGGEFTRKLMIRVRKEQAGWRVSNYMEY
ncbi:MAG: hypothetical protein OXN22_00130 [Deltaproteobacteria bacterium]|nr:hypothetical protein [Deltaproteobacteria bacterium]